MAARILSGFEEFNIMGIKAIELISRLAQVYKGVLADNAIMVEVIKDQQKIH